MNEDWFTLIKQNGIPGARDKFESICSTLFKKIYPEQNVRRVEVKKGDGGIDIFIGEIDSEPIHVIQCKFFPKNFGDSQKSQIRKSFKTSIGSTEYKMSKWTLCVVVRLDLNENKWWVSWKNKMIKEHNLADDFINLKDGDDLIDLLKEHNLYNTVFEKEDSIKIDKIYKELTNDLSFNRLEKSIQNASTSLSKVKNYFEKDTTSHIERTETKKIIHWIKNDLQHPQKNILILEGDKGLGKSVILKDVYDSLVNEKYLVLGVKADKYYAKSPKELENKLFLNEKISFSKIIEIVNTYDKQLIVIIDQLDALSQTLSSNREYIYTYNRIINELANEENIRVIISSRTYDLKYDAELSIYKSDDYKNIKTCLLSEEDVQKTLNKFNASCSVKKVIELLRTPNHLEIFCKLPDKDKINLNALSSLKNLYDELWDKLVLKQNKLQLDKLLFKIAVEMYDRQQIVVKKQFVENFNSELNYLLSNQLLNIEDNNVQFFHQTFYDYCFSKQFVKNGKDIYDYLNHNQQNLEIRSIIKMVFEYLRECNPKKYIKYTKSILKSNKYRFHIKSLIINDLGLIDPKNEEKKLLGTHILNKKKYEDVFINSVFSKKWIEYLIENKIPDKYLFIKKNYFNSLYGLYKKQSFFKSNYFENFNFEKVIENKKDSIFTLFRNNINKVPYQIITCLHNLPDFKDKNIFIERILCSLDNWEDKRILPYFENYLLFHKESKGRYNFWYYKTLEKIFEHYPNYVFEKSKPIFIDTLNESKYGYSIDFPYDQKEFIRKMYSLSPEDTFIFLLSVYENVINDNKQTESYKEFASPYYACSKFYDSINSSYEESHIFIQELLLKHLLSNKGNKQYILNFYEKYKNSNSIHIVRLVVLFFKETIENYIDEIFELISIIHSKNGLNDYDNLFQLYIRQLIGNSYMFFSDFQKEQLAEILLSIKYPYDLRGHRYKDSEGNDKVCFSGYGRKLYLFLCLIPIQEINKNPNLKKKYLEFKRIFREVDANKAINVSSHSAYRVGTPLKQSAYSNMNLESWKKSILKFDDNYVEGFGSKGGKVQHSRAFKDTVKQNPSKFYNFIFKLFGDKRVSMDYLSSGIEGLIDGKYEPNKVKILYKKLINLNLDSTNILYTIWKTDYLIQHKLIDEEIMNFLTSNAINHPNPKKPLNENDPLFDSLNTVRGAAIHKILNCCEYIKFSKLIFKTIEKAANDPQISVRVAILHGIAYLNSIDINRSFNIFQKLVAENNVAILKNSIWASNYFNNKFHNDMISYFEDIIKNNEIHKDGRVIILSWLNDKINDKELFEKFINSSKEAKLCALYIAEENLINKNKEINIKSLHIINSFLNQKDKEFSNAYSGLILRKVNNGNFIKLYLFLNKYSKTSLCLDEPKYFLDLLIACAKDYPKKCLKLVKNMNFNNPPNIQDGGYYREEPVQLILAIYSKLNMDSKNNKEHIKKSLDIFDAMLTHNHLRASAKNAIELII